MNTSVKMSGIACITFSLTSIAAAAGPPSPAQDPPDTVFVMPAVTVSPTLAPELSPVTFSGFDRDEIAARQGVLDLPAILSELPSATFQSDNGNGVGYTYLNLRGFDQRRISVMINGIPQNDPEDHNVYWIDVPDIAASLGELQVQRGAGSAFYGPPAIGGSINLIASPYVASPGAVLETMAGFQEFGDGSGVVLDTRKYSIAVNSGPVAGKYLFHGRLSRITSDGYRRNAWADLTSYFLGAVRTDETMTTQIHVYGGPISDGLSYYGLPSFTRTDPSLRRDNLSYWEENAAGDGYAVAVARRPQEIEEFSQPHYELLHEWRTGGATIANALFYITGDGFFDYDGSWADTSMLRIGWNYGIPADENPAATLIRASVSNRQWGWLPRLSFAAGKHAITTGAEVRIHRSSHYGTIEYAEGLPDGYDPEYRFYGYRGEKDMLSVFFHDAIEIGEQTGVTADLQVAWNRYGIEDEKYLDNEFSHSYVFVNPRLGIRRTISGEWSAYFSAAYTSREPRLRNLYAAEDSWFGATPQFEGENAGGAVIYDFSKPFALPERLMDFELGARYNGAAGSAGSAGSAAVNLFWMEFYDELIRSGSVDIFGQPVTGNAKRSRHAGVEAEGRWAAGGGVSVSGNATFSVNRLVSHTELDPSGNPVVLDGNPVAAFPDLLGNLRLTWAPDRFHLSALVKYVGPYYTDNHERAEARVADHTVVNAEARYVFGARPEADGGAGNVRLTVRAEVRNLFNRLYFSGGEGTAFFPAAERSYLLGLTLGI